MKFKAKRKGTITQGIAQNANPLYKSQGLKGHTGVDWTRGYGSLVASDNAGYVYKRWDEGDLKSNWAAVYVICPTDNPDEFIEVTIGHLSKITVDAGTWIAEDQPVGEEGNKGNVYSGGKEITPAMQRAGDRRGSHVHESYRPTTRVSKKRRGQYYLLNGAGKAFQDTEGMYYEIINRNNGLNGCIDPMVYYHEDTKVEKLKSAIGLLKLVLRLIKKRNSMIG